MSSQQLRNARMGGKQHLTAKQKENLLDAYKALQVNTTGTPDPDAISGVKMVVLENKGMVYRHEVIGTRTLFRLTPLGIKIGQELYTAANQGDSK